MIVGIIGYGVVGGATAEIMRRMGHTVKVRDIDPSKAAAAQTEGYCCLEKDTNVDVLFLCVPEGNLRDALASTPDSPISVIRSTVPPGTTEGLSKELGRSLVFMPEFLREATALWDAINPPFVLIGCSNPEQERILAQLFDPLLAPITLVLPSTAEMVKLALNAYLHTLVSFWNEIHLICNRMGIRSFEVGKLCAQDPRVAAYGATMHGKPAGGNCLPKDLAQLIAFAEDKCHEPQLLRAVKQVNQELLEHTNGTLDDPQLTVDFPQLDVFHGRSVRISDSVKLT